MKRLAAEVLAGTLLFAPVAGVAAYGPALKNYFSKTASAMTEEPCVTYDKQTLVTVTPTMWRDSHGQKTGQCIENAGAYFDPACNLLTSDGKYMVKPTTNPELMGVCLPKGTRRYNGTDTQYTGSGIITFHEGSVKITFGDGTKKQFDDAVQPFDNCQGAEAFAKERLARMGSACATSNPRPRG